jgi:adhesin/invasin
MRPAQFLPTGLTTAVLLACGGDDLILPSDGDPASITIVQGDSLSGRVGERLAQPLVIEVLDGADRPMANARVAIDLTGASAEPDTLTTDELGRASAEITLGSQIGETEGVARVIAPEGPVEVRAGFTLVALAASANGLSPVSGDEQSGAAGTTLSDPLVVEVMDAFGNPIANQPITWTAEGGGSVSETATTTDAQGRSSVSRTLGPASGTQTTLASSEDLAGSPVVFTHIVTAGSPSGVSVVSGNEQFGAPGTTLPDPLVVAVVDGAGNPVVGAAVTWVVTGGGGSLDPATGTTDGNGRASTVWTLGPGIGPNAAQAIVSGVGEAAFTATASAGDPDDIRIISGNEQQGQAGTQLANGLVVEVIDESENPVPGVTVTWRVESGGGSVSPRTATTDGAGRAATAWTLGPGTGEQRVEASAPSAGSVRFEATATAGSPSGLRMAVQPSRNAQVGIPFPRQPVIQVRDASGNPVPAPGVTVTAAIANGAGTLLGTATQATGPDGQAVFTNLGIGGAVGTHRLIFAASGFTSVTSGSIDVNSVQTTTRIVSASPDPSAPGQGVEVVFEVTASGVTPVGTVRISVSGGSESCSAEVGAGRCTIVLTGEGERTLTARFEGGSLFGSSTDTEPHEVITPDSPPTAANDAYAATAGATLREPAPGVLGNDSDVDGDPLSAAVQSGPSHGSLTLNSNGSFDYTPDPLYFGQDLFTYQVTANGRTASATVTIVVSPPGP